MKTVIRSCVFETNSSSSHAIVICSEEEANLIKTPGMWYKETDDDLIIKSFDELKKEISDDPEFKKWKKDSEYWKDKRICNDLIKEYIDDELWDWRCLTELEGVYGVEWHVRSKGKFVGIGVLSYTYMS